MFKKNTVHPTSFSAIARNPSYSTPNSIYVLKSNSALLWAVIQLWKMLSKGCKKQLHLINIVGSPLPAWRWSSSHFLQLLATLNFHLHLHYYQGPCIALPCHQQDKDRKSSLWGQSRVFRRNPTGPCWMSANQSPSFHIISISYYILYYIIYSSQGM